MSGVLRWGWADDPEILRQALARDGILAIPTESSYGLAVDPRSERAVQAVFALKGRDGGKPLPVVVESKRQIHDLGGETSEAERLGLIALWPAALTLVLPLREPLAAAAGGQTLGFRVPAHSRLRELLGALGHGLTATSANLSGEAPILDPQRLDELLVRSDAVIVDDGILPGGAPSTLIDVAEEIRLLRAGRVPLESLPPVLREEGS